MGKRYVFQWVDIRSIQFINNKNDLKFEFHNCTAENGDYCGALTCINILSFKMATHFDDDIDIFFPQYVIDVYVETQHIGDNSVFTVMLQGGSYDICISCKDVQIEKVD